VDAADVSAEQLRLLWFRWHTMLRRLLVFRFLDWGSIPVSSVHLWLVLRLLPSALLVKQIFGLESKSWTTLLG